MNEAQTRQHTHGIAALLLAAVVAVFVGSGALKTMPSPLMDADRGHCRLMPCTAASPMPAMPFCVTHCLTAARADHAVATTVVLELTVGLIALALVVSAPTAVSVVRSGVRGPDDLHPLRFIRTVVLRE